MVMSFPIILVFYFCYQVEVVLVSVFADPPFLEGIFDGAMWLVAVGTVGKLAIFGQGK